MKKNIVLIQQPLFSIIIPTYNRAHLICETLDSILAQTYQNWECIVVDDWSIDNTEEVMAEYMDKDSRFQYHHRPKDRMPGGNAARNHGFELSKGEFVQWFDDDDIMLPDFLEKKILHLKAEINLIISPTTLWNPDNNERRKIGLKKSKDIYQDYLCWRLSLITASVLFRRSFLQDKELFSNKIIRGQETEFFLRVFYQLPESSYKLIEDSLFLYRNHLQNKSTKDNSGYHHTHANNKYYIYYENYLKLHKTDDKESIHFCYERLLSIFYSSLHQKHKELSRKIIREFFPLLKPKNYPQAMEIIFIANMFYFTQKVSYSVINRWKKFDF